MMKVTREFRVRIVAVFCVLAFGLLIATAADLYEPKPERVEYVRDEWGVPYQITFPPVEGGISLADVGGWIIVFAFLSGVGVLLNHQLLELELAGQEVIDK